MGEVRGVRRQQADHLLHPRAGHSAVGDCEDPQPWALHVVLSKLLSVLCTQYTRLCTLYSVYSSLYSVLSILLSVLCTQYTLYLYFTIPPVLCTHSFYLYMQTLYFLK